MLPYPIYECSESQRNSARLYSIGDRCWCWTRRSDKAQLQYHQIVAQIQPTGRSFSAKIRVDQRRFMNCRGGLKST